MKFSSVSKRREDLRKLAGIQNVIKSIPSILKSTPNSASAAKGLAGAAKKGLPTLASKKGGIGLLDKVVAGAAMGGAGVTAASKAKGYRKQQDAAYQYSPSTGLPKMADDHIMSKVAKEAPDIYEYLLKSREAIMNDEFADVLIGEMDELIKNASVASATSSAKKGAKAVGEYALGAAKVIGAGVGSAIAVSLASDLYDAIKRGMTRTKSFDNMLKVNPELKKKPKNEVKQLFGVLHRVAPGLAGNPTIAASFVHNQMALESGVDIQTVKTLIDAQKGLSQSGGLNMVRDLPTLGVDPREHEKVLRALKKLKENEEN